MIPISETDLRNVAGRVVTVNQTSGGSERRRPETRAYRWRFVVRRLRGLGRGGEEHYGEDQDGAANAGEAVAYDAVDEMAPDPGEEQDGGQVDGGADVAVGVGPCLLALVVVGGGQGVELGR